MKIFDAMRSPRRRRWSRSARAEMSYQNASVQLRVLVAMAVAAGALGFSPYGVALWLVVASIAAFNGGFHLWATIIKRRYSPGLITGCLIYIPLAAYGFWYFSRTRLAGPGVLVQAALIGPAYHIFAAWNHRFFDLRLTIHLSVRLLLRVLNPRVG